MSSAAGRWKQRLFFMLKAIHVYDIMNRTAYQTECRDENDQSRGRGYLAWRDYWEFPGGKIEPGETPEAALVREIREELDVGITVLEHLCDVEYDYPEFHLSMQCFRCRIDRGEPKLLEHEAARWLGREELDSVRWLPADLQILPEIERNWPA